MKRREVLPLMGVGLGGLLGVAVGCTPRYEVEPAKGALKPEALQTVESYEVMVVKGELEAFRTGTGDLYLYKNPLGVNIPINRRLGLRGPTEKYNASYGISGSKTELLVVSDQDLGDNEAFHPRRNLEFTKELRLSLANSRGNESIGRYKVLWSNVLRANQVFHPNELLEKDRDKKVYWFRLDLPDSGGGDNVLRVLDNDFFLSFEVRDLATGQYPRKEVYLFKQ